VTSVASIKTSAEEGPFSMITNGSKEALFCRKLIVGVVGRGIVDATFFTTNDSVIPFYTTMGLVIDEDRVNSVT